MSSTRYNDFNMLTRWIDNQKAFEKHKKKLDNIYTNLNKHSEKEFGIRENKSYDLMQTKIKNLTEQQKFNKKEKLFFDGKNDQLLGGKINLIQNRKNILLFNEDNFNDRNTNLKRRIEKLKEMENEKIRNENEKMGRRIMGKISSVNLKKFDEEYQKSSNYKSFNKKFELPKITAAGPVVVKRKLDINAYNRANRMLSIASSKSLDDDISNSSFLKTPFSKKIKKNISQENIHTQNYNFREN